MSSVANTTPRSTGKWKTRFLRKGVKNDPEIETEDDGAKSLSKRDSQRAKKGSGFMRKLKGLNGSFRKERSVDNRHEREESHSTMVDGLPTVPSNPQSPYSNDSLVTVETNEVEKNGEYLNRNGKEDRRKREVIYEKQRIKERDGFCRRVDTYDGQVIVVDHRPTYEIGNYLGGGVAGVVYEGYRLRPLDEYPMRTGIADKPLEIPTSPDDGPEAGFFCSPVEFGDAACGGTREAKELQTEDAASGREGVEENLEEKQGATGVLEEEDLAIEATVSHNVHGVMLDAQDAPSRSKHYTKAASVKFNPSKQTQQGKSLVHGLTEEAVAIKILNPVGFRILQSDGLKGSVIVKEGEPMEPEVKKGLRPLQEKHVWWLVNPNSRNLRTLQRYSGKNNAGTKSKSVQVDRGTANKGLRLSLIAAYIDPRTNTIRELTLTRCIEIWGHIPFNATDNEFEDMMTALERVNAGQQPPPIPEILASQDTPPERVGTDVTGADSTISHGDDMQPLSLRTARTGLLRAALTQRVTVFCEELNAYIAIPAVPSKYLRWLRQRRAATKEIRNMMSIGRHKNVLHLFEVLEFIQDSKSTMFLILELVKGGELFDLISSSNTGSKSMNDPESSENMMKKFFSELASGVDYCHKNGIAHRDLKPENLLVHSMTDGQAILKIADFGLSSAFGPHGKTQASDTDTLIDSLGSPMSQNSTDSRFGQDTAASPMSQTSGGSLKDSMDNFIASGASALSFLTCGAVLCMPNGISDIDPSPLRRMSSVVGSPHYVAPEIISQTDDNKSTKSIVHRGYDGAKADVWSAGVILYAMLFRSLPFGEDLLRCPRFQSYQKWYDEVRELGGRRSSAAAALNPNISEGDERDFLGPHWFFPATTSPESRDLIVAMLNPKPEDRLSVAQILQHVWLVKED